MKILELNKIRHSIGNVGIKVSKGEIGWILAFTRKTKIE
jgi:hypothetical protein